MRRPDAATLAVVRDLLASVADEMALSCMRTALSPNIRDRRDLSAAVFDAQGVMLSHAAHIPVHLGAMPLSVRSVCTALSLGPGDVALMNDPFAGGTHLPDITVVAPVFASTAGGAPSFLVALRAHHADVGGPVPGSMAPQESVFGEGVRIPPVRWLVNGREQEDVRALLLANMRAPDERAADLRAQVGALAVGASRLRAIAAPFGGLHRLAHLGEALVPYAATLAKAALGALPNKHARVALPLDAPALDGKPARVVVSIKKAGGRLHIDFTGTSGPVLHGLNATRAVTISAVYHLMRCLCPPQAPPNEGLMTPVVLHVPAGSMLDAMPPHPVAGGNVETSQRVVDALWLAAARCWPARIPAPGCGSMSNWSFGPVPGGPEFPTYYETVPGGRGCGAGRAGARCDPAAHDEHALHSGGGVRGALAGSGAASRDPCAIRRGGSLPGRQWPRPGGALRRAGAGVLPDDPSPPCPAGCGGRWARPHGPCGSRPRRSRPASRPVLHPPLRGERRATDPDAGWRRLGPRALTVCVHTRQGTFGPRIPAHNRCSRFLSPIQVYPLRFARGGREQRSHGISV